MRTIWLLPFFVITLAVISACQPAATPTPAPPITPAPAQPQAPAPPPAPSPTAASPPGYVDPEAVDSSEVTFKSEGFDVTGYLSKPKSTGSFPGLIIIHENRGLTPHIQDVARRFANQGYVTLATDLLSRTGGTAQYATTAEAVAAIGTLSSDGVIADLNSAFAYLQSRPDVQAERIGVIGYCWGGGNSLLFATRNSDLSAAVVYYGPNPANIADVANIAAPVLGIFGEEDTRISMNVPALVEAMQKYDKPFEYEMYRGAAHAFFNDTGTRYHPEAAQGAWQVTLSFLQKRLKHQSASALTTAPTPTPPPAPPLNTIAPGSVKVERVFPNLSFLDMTNLVQPDDTSGLIFITEQSGAIHAFDPGQPQQASRVFLDLTGKVNRGGNEEGLLGLAFAPGYRENGYFYVYYSAANPRRSVLSRFSLDRGNPDVADQQSEVIIMEVAQPFSNHNGGQLAFGRDGYLYIALGDGGSGGDPQGNGQNPGALLGSILRIDVGGLTAAGDYKIPADNPFVNTPGARGEIWAYGLRNPWRFSFDKETGLMWSGDVGQNNWEEINIITRGANYGWNIMEGLHCYSPATGCDPAGLTPPTVEYDHSQGCSVTGGYVYRGESIPSLRGYYVYGDYCSGKIWALSYQGNAVTQNILLAESGLSITSFGEDLAGNLYILSRDGGIYTLAQAE